MTGDGSVRRFLAFKKGDVLTPEKIRQTQRDLYSTNAFREVNISTEPIAGGDGTAHKVLINLTEAKPLLLVLNHDESDLADVGADTTRAAAKTGLTDFLAQASTKAGGPSGCTRRFPGSPTGSSNCYRKR